MQPPARLYPDIDNAFLPPATRADIAAQGAAAVPATTARRSGAGKCGALVFAWAYKGGVNKTSIAMQLAHRGASKGLRVVLVDMNRGQGGIRTMLRIADDAPIRSAYDASVSGDPADAILMPDELASSTVRASTLEPIDFAVVLAPPRSEADINGASWAVYRQIIEHARSVADLVIVDTQTVEATDNSGLIDNVMVPLMIDDAWGVAITEFAKESVDNLIAALQMYAERGLKRDRQLLAVTRVQNFDQASAAGVDRKFGAFARFAGTTAISVHVKDQLDRGRIVSDDPAVRPLLDTVLLRVTGNTDFEERANRPKRRGLFGGGRR
ncbi:ParA family protein [Agromyces humi]|uniref:ParA family protein n=1 Tax=Agromyces humi TaxID=1766800 RepID=UPI00135901B4|nr:ParA family protein [Agromyces humi]